MTDTPSTNYMLARAFLNGTGPITRNKIVSGQPDPDQAQAYALLAVADAIQDLAAAIKGIQSTQD